MHITLPFLTAYDPPGSSEGTLDPLGLYQIADQLGVLLVPAVRERMQRIRFLTAMAVGTFVTEGLDDNPEHRDASPYLAWEWLVVESMIRTTGETRGVPGTLVTRRALDDHDYLDARSYLKTPRIFGFHGVYKRLAVHLGIVDVHLGPGPNAEKLVDAWAKGLGIGGLEGARSLMGSWTTAIKRGLGEKPPRTKPGWSRSDWAELAKAFDPSEGKTREKRVLQDLLLAVDDRRLGALPQLWELQKEFEDDEYVEEALHNRLEKRDPSYAPLLKAIRSYEAFARSLQDGFDVLIAEASRSDTLDYAVTEIAQVGDFRKSVANLHARFETAHQALSEITIVSLSLPNLFAERFQSFAEPMDAGTCALALCDHHVKVQRSKSANGKRPWFDRIGNDRIYIRHAYREPRRDILPGRYAHPYRGVPIRMFWRDLS